MISDLFPQPGELRDRQAGHALGLLAAAIAPDATGAPDPRYAPYAERIRQAERKIAAGQPVRRVAELMALVQFGAGSIGRAVADACGAPGAAPACEAQFVADCLVAVAARSPEAPHLVPDDLRRRHGGGTGGDAADGTGGLPPPAAIADLLDRAASAIPAATPSGHRGLDRFLARRAALCARRIARLRRAAPGSGRTELTVFDRIAVGLRLLCRRMR